MLGGITVGMQRYRASATGDLRNIPSFFGLAGMAIRRSTTCGRRPRKTSTAEGHRTARAAIDARSLRRLPGNFVATQFLSLRMVHDQRSRCAPTCRIARRRTVADELCGRPLAATTHTLVS